MTENNVQLQGAQAKVTDPRLGEYNEQWWARLDSYHRKKVQYLGKLVDCSNPNTYKQWWKLLEANDRDPVREIADGAKNIDISPTTSTDTESKESEEERRVEADGSTNLGYDVIKVGSGFRLKRKITVSSISSTKYEPTETITFRQYTSEDPNGIPVDVGTHYTNFEIKLCEHILSEIKTTLEDDIEEIEKEMKNKDKLVAEKEKLAAEKEKLATEKKKLAAKEKLATEKKKLAEEKEKLAAEKKKLESVKKEVESLDVKDLSVTRFEKFISKCSDDKDESLKWRVVANACTSYINGKQVRGCTHYVHCITLGTIVKKSEVSESKTVTKSVKGEMQGKDYVDAKVGVESETTHKSKSTETVTQGTKDKPDVIEITTRAVSDLISDKSRDLSRLKGVIEKLIKRHDTIDKESEAGPLIIYYKKNAFRKIYWQVVEKDNSPADKSEFEIHGTTDDKKASFFYMKHINRSPPQFYIIHNPESGNPLYVTVKRPFNAHLPLPLIEGGINDQDTSFTMEAAIQTDGKGLSLPDTTDKWTHQKPVFLKLPCGRDLSWIYWRAERYVGMQADGSTYKTVSYNRKDHGNMMLFSFGNALSIKGAKENHSFHAGPPPPPKKMEDEDRIINWPDDSEVEHDNAAFYKLVGEDYVFPFQVKP